VALDVFQTFLNNVEDIETQAKLLLECADKLDSIDRLSADSCRGLACMAKAGTISEGLSVFVASRGNLLQVWDDDGGSIVSFLQQCPSAAGSLAVWAASRRDDHAVTMSSNQNSDRASKAANRYATRQILAPPPPPPPPPPRSNHRKLKPDVKQSDYADLRRSHQPQDPEECKMVYQYLVSKPRSPPGCLIYTFAPDPQGSGRLRRWLWWRALAEIGIYVRELYAFTNFESYINASAVGNDGVMGVKMTNHPDMSGTINWFVEDQRIDCENGSSTLWWHLQLAFDPWDPQAYGGPRYGRQVPKQISKAFPELQTRTWWQPYRCNPY
jgi:hypothetical protein